VIPVFDGHNDALIASRPLLARATEGHPDVPRAREGGFAGGLFAIFTRWESSVAFPAGEEPRRAPDVAPEPAVPRARALRTTLGALGELLALEAEAPAAVRVTRTAAEAEAALRVPGGPLAAAVHVEGAEVLDPGLEALGPLHALGLRSLGITWSRPNVFGEALHNAAHARSASHEERAELGAPPGSRTRICGAPGRRGCAGRRSVSPSGPCRPAAPRSRPS